MVKCSGIIIVKGNPKHDQYKNGKYHATPPEYPQIHFLIPSSNLPGFLSPKMGKAVKISAIPQASEIITIIFVLLRVCIYLREVTQRNLSIEMLKMCSIDAKYVETIVNTTALQRNPPKTHFS